MSHAADSQLDSHPGAEKGRVTRGCQTPTRDRPHLQALYGERRILPSPGGGKERVLLGTQAAPCSPREDGAGAPPV